MCIRAKGRSTPPADVILFAEFGLAIAEYNVVDNPAVIEDIADDARPGQLPSFSRPASLLRSMKPCRSWSWLLCRNS